MSSTFVLMFHFAHELFFCLEIPMTFTFIITMSIRLKQVTTKLEILTHIMYLTDIFNHLCHFLMRGAWLSPENKRRISLDQRKFKCKVGHMNKSLGYLYTLSLYIYKLVDRFKKFLK